MIELSEKAKRISPSATLEITAKAKALKAAGKQIVAFTAGEPDFNTPDYIIRAAKDALDKGLTKYTAASGIAELKEAIADKFLIDNGLTFKPSQIVVTDGAKSALYHALSVLLSDGDEAIIPAPYWVTYTEQVKLCGATPVVVSTKKENGYKITGQEFEEAVTGKTKVFILNSPCNPTGAVYSERELVDLAAVAERHGIKILSDEIYEKLVFDGRRHVSVASVSDYARENTVIVNGVSKSYSMTGWRIGYLAAPENVAKAASAMQGHTTSNPCTFAQYATVAALTGKEGDDFIKFMRGEFDKRRKLLAAEIDKIGLDYVRPEGAFYLFVDVSPFFGKKHNGVAITDVAGFSSALLDYGVAVIPGVAFGAPDYVRLSYTVSESDIIKGTGLVSSFIKGLSD